MRPFTNDNGVISESDFRLITPISIPFVPDTTLQASVYIKRLETINMSYYDNQQWPAPGSQGGWDQQTPPARSGRK
jgi:hypothetical protein